METTCEPTVAAADVLRQAAIEILWTLPDAAMTEALDRFIEIRDFWAAQNRG